jgi:ABC-type multidrug transport system fused ATPase/permease subunit
MEDSWRGSGLWELLRYAIPGLLTILYTFAFLFVFIGMHSFPFKYFIKTNLSTVTIFLSLFALPIGFLAYQLCLAFEYEKFLEKRDGGKIIRKIYDLIYEVEDPLQLRGECGKESRVAKINEIMDTIFFKYEKELGNDISRAIMVYMSTLTVVKYVPIFAFFLTTILIFLFGTSHLYIPFFHVVFYLLFHFLRMLILALLFFIIYLIVEAKILGNKGFLKKNINELEKNTLLLREYEIQRLIKMKVEFRKRKIDNKE